MNEHQKAAYRYLLYWAMLGIRNQCQSRGKYRFSILEWRRQYARSRLAGAVADWLHNLALYSCSDFGGFNEEWFWKEHASICQRFPGGDLEHYRRAYDSRLSELSNGESGPSAV